MVVEAKSSTFLEVTDEQNRSLDVVKWFIPTPLVRQYRLHPGTYEIYVNSNKKPVTLHLTKGSLRFMKLGPKDPSDGIQPGIYPASFQPISELSEQLVQELSLKGFEEEIAPKHLDPATNALYLGTDAPWDIPMRPQPSPTPPPKK